CATAAAPLRESGLDYFSPNDIMRVLRSHEVPGRATLNDTQRAIKKLREAEWLSKHRVEEKYRFSVELVRQWVVRSFSMWEVVDEYRKEVLAYLAPVGRRETARLIDTAVSTIIIGGTLLLILALREEALIATSLFEGIAIALSLNAVFSAASLM